MPSFRKAMAQWSHLTKVSLQGSFIATVLAHWINANSHAASQIKGPGALEQNGESVGTKTRQISLVLIGVESVNLSFLSLLLQLPNAFLAKTSKNNE